MKYLVFTLAAVMATPAAANEMAQAMADGAPWDMQDPSGRSANLTLNPAGTGRVRLGLMGTSATGGATEEGLCLTTRPLGEVRLTLARIEGGFVGTADDQGTFVFKR